MLRFIPEYHSVAWGGRRLHEAFGRAIPEGPIGEAWELVDMDGHQSKTAGGDELRALWQTGKLGGSARGVFPFLLKWLDTTQWLSVQVHPDEEACKQMGRGEPKSEAWFVAKADSDAKLLAGHRAGLDQKTIESSAADGSIVKWLYELTPREGEMIMVRAGTLHAIGPGYLVLEVQQPSKTTYRVSDWGRVGLDGKPRQLHLAESIASTRIDRPGAPPVTRDRVVGPCFTMESVRDAKSPVEPKALRVFAAADKVALKHDRGTENLRFGDIVVAEPADGPVHVQGHAVVLSEP